MVSRAESEVEANGAVGAPAAVQKAAKDAYQVPTIGEAVSGEAEAGGGDDFVGVDEIPGSLCMRCGGEGTTRMLTTKIPFFREVIISSFECDDCHWKNNEVRFASQAP